MKKQEVKVAPGRPTSEQQELGINSDISRRDFLGGVLVGAGTALLSGNSLASPSLESVDAAREHSFNGFAGPGDYSRSNGNTWEVVSAAHRVRDRAYANASVLDTGESFDLIIVGGGAAGLGAAYYHAKQTGRRARSLILDNHPVFGGEAKRNEFVVDGIRLMAPQGSNIFVTPYRPGDGLLYEEITDIGMPLEFEYVEPTGLRKPMEFDVSNYLYIWESFKSPSIGLYFDDPVFGRSNRWLLNPWEARLEGLNVPEPLKRELLRWRYSLKQPRPDGPDTDRWLDAMTYRDYLVREQHLPQAIADFAEPMLASGVGFGSSVVSAYTAIKKVGMPGGSGADDVFGVKGLRPNQDLGHILDHKPVPNCFPGGNAEVARAFLKYLIPDAVEGSAAFNDLVTSPISFDNLDKAGQPVRVRLSAQVVDVRHETSPKTGVRVVYAKAGKLFATNARAVVMASGGWITKHVVSDLPKEHLRAFDEFHNAPVVVANVAIRNWRFLEKLGMSSGVYTGGEFGFSCNIRRPMKLANYAPPLDPSKPIVLTFYAPMLKPGLSAAAQGAQCRAELLATSYLEFEGRIRRQMLRLFGAAGLDPVRDIAGITINRWGHALVVPTPGFTFGRNGAPAPPDVIRQEHGRIAFASAELRGLQNFRGAVYESKRAVQQLARYFGGV